MHAHIFFIPTPARITGQCQKDAKKPEIIDIGAHMGQRAALSIAMGCRVLAFEHNYHLVHHLKRTLVFNHHEFNAVDMCTIVEKPVVGSVVEHDTDAGDADSSKNDNRSSDGSSGSDASGSTNGGRGSGSRGSGESKDGGVVAGKEEYVLIDDHVKHDVTVLSIRLEMFSEALKSAVKLFQTYKVRLIVFIYRLMRSFVSSLSTHILHAQCTFNQFQSHTLSCFTQRDMCSFQSHSLYHSPTLSLTHAQLSVTHTHTTRR